MSKNILFMCSFVLEWMVFMINHGDHGDPQRCVLCVRCGNPCSALKSANLGQRSFHLCKNNACDQFDDVVDW